MFYGPKHYVVNSLTSICFTEADSADRSTSFERKVHELHAWLSSAESKLSLPMKIGDADEMDRAAQRHAVGGIWNMRSFRL